MSYVINSIPLWIRIVALAICEIIMIYEYAKDKLGKSKVGKSFFLLLIIFDPIFIGIMLFGRLQELGIVSAPSFHLSTVFSVAFCIGIWVLAFIHLKKGRFPENQKRMLMGAFTVFLICVILLIIITVLEKMGVIS